MKVETEDIANFLGIIDLFLCSSGFEDRSTYLGSTLKDVHIKKAIIFHIEDTYQLSKENLEAIKKNIAKLETVEYPKNSPLVTYDKFYEIFSDLQRLTEGDEKLKVVIDITTFTREILLILIKLLSSEPFVSIFDVDFVYTPAESYSDNDSNLWLTKGIRDIRSVLGYSGMHTPSKELLLILLSGFEEERAEEIIISFEPNKLVLGKASNQDSINEELNKIANIKYETLKNSHSSILADEFEFSCVNIKETQQKIESLYKTYGDSYNIVISPLNNKVSTIGVAVAGLKNENLQICYASANQYNINAYSKRSDYFLTYNLAELIG